MVANRKTVQGKPLMPPEQRRTVDLSGGPIVIDTAIDTLLMTLPELIAGHGPVLVIAMVRLNVTPNGGLITFKLFRDGVEIDSASQENFNTAFSPQSRTFQYVDETPGASPIYTFLALAALINNEATAGRLSCHL